VLQQIAKFFYGYSGVFDNPAHRQSVYRIVTRYGDEMRTVSHDDVLALAHNAETSLFQRPHGWEMGIHRAGTPVDGLNGRMVMRPSDREIASQFSAFVRPTLPLRARRNHGGFH
jgi:hypothetical protein